LDYLDSLRVYGLAYNTVISHASALSACIPPVDGTTVGASPLVVKWLAGFKALSPPRRLLVPPWDLAIVLAALRAHPYAPLETAPLQYVTLTGLFLLAITSVRRVSELQAVCAVPPFVLVNPRNILFRINPAFVPKTVTSGSLDATINLHAFPAVIRTTLDATLRETCPVRAICLYLSRTKHIRNDDQLFVAYGSHRKGTKVSKQTLARWFFPWSIRMLISVMTVWDARTLYT